MDELSLQVLTGTAIPLIMAFLLGWLLLRWNRASRNPLEWNMVDRCLLLIALYSFAGGVSHAIIGIGVSVYYEQVLWVNRSIVQLYYEIVRIVGLPIVGFLLVGVWLRWRTPQNRVFAYTLLQYNAIHMAAICYAFGPVTHSGPFLFSMALGTLNFLLFERGVALSWVVTFTVLMVASTVATWLGWIPYAPLYLTSPFTNGDIESLYLIGNTTFVLLLFLVVLLLISYIFSRWRDREAKVAEMTVLLKKMFGRYLSTEVMTTLIENPSALELGGERRRVTIMMTDLRGFTALSERLQPEQVVQMLNAYFEVMVDVILEYNGTINEIIGDALLVIFGAPQEMPHRSQQAIACAIAMQNAMAHVNRENRDHGLPELEMGIGLNEAEVIVGNIGSSKRSKYAVVGSGVNMTSRIESYTVGGQILISESVRQEAGEILRIDSQFEVLPKGAETPLTIYEIGGISGNYHLALEDRLLTMVPLMQPVPLKVKVLEGKSVGRKGLRGSIRQLSARSAGVSFAEPLRLMANLKMNFADLPEEMSKKDFYGKVVGHMQNNKESLIVRFTSVPPEISAYFQALLKYNAGMPGDRS